MDKQRFYRVITKNHLVIKMDTAKKVNYRSCF